ncbi:mevalonate kinase [Auritidibacter ignavus]|uniref:mevalonate kinase n=1 Tax=Auritidibacter ignavus TaxID=678932 RepID=UPI00109D3908|nr:mevalonate kinase [Auritidibacter ignavus]
MQPTQDYAPRRGSRHHHAVVTAPEGPTARESKDPSTGVQSGLGSAHGKAILIGEHAVVYGAPAIALPLLDLQATASVRDSRRGYLTTDLYTGPLNDAPKDMGPIVTALRASAEKLDVRADRLDVILRSTIPFERGLGSSAATAAAVVRAVANHAGVRLSAAEAHELVQTAETVAHGTSSGLDAHAVQSLAPLRFQQGKPTTVQVGAGLTFVIGDTGTVGSTAAAVGGTRMLRDIQPAVVDRVMEDLADLTDDVAVALGDGDAVRVGRNMHEAHTLLAYLGVSAPALDALVAAALEAGAYGAKLTGSGLGGCVLALVPDQEHAGKVAAAMTAVGATRVWTTSLTPNTTDNQTAPTARIAPSSAPTPSSVQEDR